MLREEYGLAAEVRSPFMGAFSTFTAFLICGAVPLVPYVLGRSDAFFAACVMTGLVFFGIGCVRSRWSLFPWWRAGLGTLALGSAAATLAYVIGDLLQSLA